jgi:hypothetical protein
MLNDIVTSLDDEPELQEVAQEVTTDDTQELPEISTGSEPETETNAEEAKPSKGRGLQESFNKLTAEKYAEKRRADELAQKLAELEAKIQQPAAMPDDLNPPELPEDTWDPEQMKKYHQEMIAYNRKLAQHEAKATYSATQQEQQKQLQDGEQRKVIEGFAKRAIEAKVDLQNLQNAGTALAGAGMSTDLQMLILEDDAGPQITMYLANNPELAHQLIGMPVAKAAVKLATEVKAKALSKKPKVTQAPDPVPEGKGLGVKDEDDFDRRYKGAKFI